MPKQKRKATNQPSESKTWSHLPRATGTTFTFPVEPLKGISYLQQVMLYLSVHSCYPVSNDLMLFPPSGPLLLVLEIISEISILPDS